MEDSREYLEEGAIVIQDASQEVVYQQDRAQIDTQIATAKAYPRDLKRVTENMVFIVSSDKVFAESCNYSLPRAGKVVSGPTVHMALVVAQQYKNMSTGARVVAIDDNHITAQAVAYDLENNFRVTIEVKRSIRQNEWKYDEDLKKNVKTGKTVRMNDDMITMTGNAANSIALRNAIYKVVPKQVIDRIYNEAKNTMLGDVSDEAKFIQKRTELFTRFLDVYGVQEAEILKVIGKANLAAVTKEDLITIIGIGQSIRDNESSVEFVFRSGKYVAPDVSTIKRTQEAQRKKLVKLLKDLGDKVDAETRKNLTRVVEKKEVNTYSKGIDYLEKLKNKPKQETEAKKSPNDNEPK